MRYNVLKSCATQVSPRGPSLALWAIHLVSRLRRQNRLCSSTVSDTANISRQGSTLCSPTVEKILCRSLFSQRSHVGNLRQTLQGKGRSSKRKENRRLSFLFVPAAGAATLPPSADGESPAAVQRKTSRPLGAKTLAQFVCPSQSVQGNDSFPIDTVGIPRYTYN